MKKKNILNKGFTLIELLVVIAIIAILAVLVFVALNPAKRFQDSRNSRRATDTGEILTAVHECIVDNAGNVVPCLGTLTTNTTYEITSSGSTGGCTASAICTGVTNCANLSTSLGAYLKTLPADPGGITAPGTEYTINVDSNNIVTINSCAAEAGVIVRASR